MTEEDKRRISRIVSEQIGPDWDVSVSENGFSVRNKRGLEHAVDMDMTEKHAELNAYAGAAAVARLIWSEGRRQSR